MSYMALQTTLILPPGKSEMRFSVLPLNQRGLLMFPWIKSAVDFVTSRKIP